MSFVSKENLLAPFSNIVNLVAILSVAGLFLLWRLMGGGFDVQSSTAGNTVSPPKVQSRTVELPPVDTAELKRREEALFKKQITPPVPPRNTEAETPQKNDSSTGLEDIERLMGLR